MDIYWLKSLWAKKVKCLSFWVKAVWALFGFLFFLVVELLPESSGGWLKLACTWGRFYLAFGFGSILCLKLEVCRGNFRNQRVRRERVGRGLLPNQAKQERKSTLEEEHPRWEQKKPAKGRLWPCFGGSQACSKAKISKWLAVWRGVAAFFSGRVTISPLFQPQTLFF